jgi:hypothetical protein
MVFKNAVTASYVAIGQYHGVDDGFAQYGSDFVATATSLEEQNWTPAVIFSADPSRQSPDNPHGVRTRWYNFPVGPDGERFNITPPFKLYSSSVNEGGNATKYMTVSP